MKWYIILLIIISTLGMSSEMFAQSDRKTEEEIYLKDYNSRIKRSRINGVYIPQNLDEALEELDSKSDSSSLDAFKYADEIEVCKKLYFGLGKWMVVNWGLERGSRYSHYLKDFGLSFPEDMSQFTMRAFHRKLNNKKIDKESLALEFVTIRNAEHEKRMKKNMISETKRVLPPEERPKKN